jgi:ribose-phosphate pyrophosphokinase
MINLTKYDPQYGSTTTIPINQWKFPGGEIGVKIDLTPTLMDTDVRYNIRMDFEGSDDIMCLLNTCDALRHAGVPRCAIVVHMPYLPYARQDRVCHPGESYALDVFVSLLKTAYCDTFSVCDAHSDVAEQLFEKHGLGFYDRAQYLCARELPDFDVLIAPDKGANQKASKHIQINHSYTELVCLSKTRTPDGIVYDDYPFDTIRGNVCVVDDLCDYGGTFIALGKMLERTQPNISKLSLYVTHGLLGKGTDELKKYYDSIYVYNLMNQSVKDQVVSVSTT